MIHKLTILIIAFLFSFRMFGQTEKQIATCENKICIDTLTTKFLIGKWYDFSPNFYVEQSSWIIYYVTEPTDMKDSTSHKGTLSINKDGTFERTYKIMESTIKSYGGTWTIPSGTRELILTTEGNGIAQTWIILELNKGTFIMKFGK